jgi:hypothetical protein
LPLHSDDDMADASPVVEPGVQRAQRRRPRWELDEPEGGGEEGAAAVSREDIATRSPHPRV